MSASPRIIAVDWSGAASGAARKIWLAEWIPANDGEPAHIARLEAGRSREALVAHLIDEVTRDPHVVIGLDFSFSLPAWFLHEIGATDAPSAWALVAREGERWLRDSPAPFWGRPGRKRPVVPEQFRRTERELPAVGGIRPKSTLQVGGAGAVGTGAIRGMPHLLALRQAGCAIWPFDAPRFPLVLEIYPRLLTGPVNKGNDAARAQYLATFHPTLPASLASQAGSSDDAFDALVSALAMGRSADDFARLPTVSHVVARLEGAIWYPGVIDHRAGDRVEV